MSNNFSVLDKTIQIQASRTGAESNVSTFGQQIVGQRHDKIMCRFEYNNSTEDVVVATTGSGTSSNANSLAIAESGTTVGSCTFTTLRNVVYRPANEIYAYGSAIFTTPEVNTLQWLGIVDTNDGFFFGYQDTSFGVFHRKGTVEVFYPKTEWNLDKVDSNSVFNLDPTKDNQYHISYGWLGIAPIIFSVYCGYRYGWRPVHVIDLGNSQTAPTINSPSLPISWGCKRTSGTGSNLTVSVGCVAGGSIEGAHAHAGHRVFAGRAASTISAGAATHIATFQNKTTFQSKVNKIAAEAVFFGGATDGTKSVEFLFYKNATLSGGSYSDIDTNNSIMAYSTTGTVSGGTFEFDVAMAKVESKALDMGAGHIHMELLPGETMSIVGLSPGASDVVITFRWEEYFS